MEQLIIDPKPKYLPLYEPMEPPVLPSKYPYSIPPSTTLPTSTPTNLSNVSSAIPKKSFSYTVIIGIVVLVCFVFYAIYYNYKSDKNNKNHILPNYTKHYKVSLDEMKDDAKKFIKNTVDTLSSYRDYIQNFTGKYFSGMHIEKGTLKTSSPKKPVITSSPPKLKNTSSVTPSTPKPSVLPSPTDTIKSSPAKTTAPTTISKESKSQEQKTK